MLFARLMISLIVGGVVHFCFEADYEALDPRRQREGLALLKHRMHVARCVAERFNADLEAELK